MEGLTFELAGRKHAAAILEMRKASGIALSKTLGPGNWSGSIRIESIRDRINCADPDNLRRTTLYVACRGSETVGSVAVSTFGPTFWKKAYWKAPEAPGLGVFSLVVFPELQGKGIGRFLMEGVEQLAREHGIPYVRLDAYLRNPSSSAFYRRLGYDERATTFVRGAGLILFEAAVRP